MAALPDGVEILLDHYEMQDQGSETASISEVSEEETPGKDVHKERYPSYQPPHKRGHNVQQDKFVNYRDRDPKLGPDPDEVMGTDNKKYQRLKIPVTFALPHGILQHLKKDFPGVYFHCKDNGNHDHPFSHLVTQVGTRFLQRRIKPGSRILDVYGNPNACDMFNKGQSMAENPKVSKALVRRTGPMDFIREVNKWGPFIDNETNEERYHRGSLRNMVDSGQIEEYDVLQMIHTLYYEDLDTLSAALHAGEKKRVAYALIHKHDRKEGSINHGEQTYTKKFVAGKTLIKQINKATGSAYVHPDITPIIFGEDKTWFPSETMATRDIADCVATKGLAWECHVVNDETWIVEFVPYEVGLTEANVPDYAAMWDLDDEMSSDFGTTDTPSSSVITTTRQVMVPTDDGKFFEIEIVNHELFSQLRMSCIGKQRTPKLVEEMVNQARHLVNPSALFGDKQGLDCPEEKIYDHVIGALLADAEREGKILEAAMVVRPTLINHARKLKLGSNFKDISIASLLESVKSAIVLAREANKIYKAKDKIDGGLELLHNFVDR